MEQLVALRPKRNWRNSARRRLYKA